MKKILVVFTGGTIGSAAVDGTIGPSSQASFKLLQLFGQQYDGANKIYFDSVQPIQILSENLAPSAWKMIIEAIEAASPENYDGIIVTHGTDTLAYTAAALSYYFHALAKPMLLVSSDRPLDNPSGNGLANFICAVEFIRQSIANGVFVPYRNEGQTMQVHRGTRLACSLQLSGDFFSVQNKYFLQFDGGVFEKTKSISNGQSDAGRAHESVRLKPEFSNRILMIKPYPGLDYSHFNLADVDAVLHDLYHSGTACASDQWGRNHSLLDFLNRCGEKRIPCYLAPAIQSENAYQSTRELMANGAEMLWNLSIEAAYVKLMLAFGNFSDNRQISDFINRDLACEHL